jgi:hypothetical protein
VSSPLLGAPSWMMWIEGFFYPQPHGPSHDAYRNSICGRCHHTYSIGQLKW